MAEKEVRKNAKKMMDRLTSLRRSENMRQIRSKDTKPELQVRRLLHGLGYRYRLHDKKLPGKPDLVFPARKKAIFVHGCFFHQHKHCIDCHIPKSRKDYWEPKLRGNVERDNTNRAKLSQAGWRSLIVWDCETKSRDDLKAKLVEFLEAE